METINVTIKKIDIKTIQDYNKFFTVATNFMMQYRTVFDYLRSQDSENQSLNPVIMKDIQKKSIKKTAQKPQTICMLFFSFVSIAYLLYNIYDVYNIKSDNSLVPDIGKFISQPNIYNSMTTQNLNTEIDICDLVDSSASNNLQKYCNTHLVNSKTTTPLFIAISLFAFLYNDYKQEKAKFVADFKQNPPEEVLNATNNIMSALKFAAENFMSTTANGISNIFQCIRKNDIDKLEKLSGCNFEPKVKKIITGACERR